METFRYPTLEGFDDLLMCTDGEALTGLWFEDSSSENQHASGIVETFPETSQISTLYPVIRDTCRWLDVYFSGRQPDFTPVYRMEGLTPFRKAVLDKVCEIPFGKTVTYGRIAKVLKVNSAQAIGGAVGWNPICLIVPCHRVMGANGNLTGYGGGIHNKIALLKLEGSLMV
jgi:methylated-DNA-[protein]-cysteine S-methyltransferase